MRQTFFVSPERSRLCVDASVQTVRAAQLLEPNDLSVYIGIPFCPTRCAYCSFVSQSIERFGAYLPEYLECLLREVRRTGELLRDSGFSVRTMYMGGGTPTTLSADQMRRLLDALQDAFDLSRCLEFTVEAGRPDTITREKLLAIREGGADRISINPQTMSDEVLAAIGRRHSGAAVLESYALAREVFPGAINMDLIAGLPADTVDGFRRTIDRVLALAPENITVHTLSRKRGSSLSENEAPLPTAQDVAAMLDYAQEQLTEMDYAPYYLYRQKFMSGGFENVGWTRRGHENLYNICIMEELCSIIAMGGGASTKLVASGGRIRRSFCPKYPKEYIETIDRICEGKRMIPEWYSA
jgi:oxygen-independent coproporphyrinogen-3 oxidase